MSIHKQLPVIGAGFAVLLFAGVVIAYNAGIQHQASTQTPQTQTVPSPESVTNAASPTTAVNNSIPQTVAPSVARPLSAQRSLSNDDPGSSVADIDAYLLWLSQFEASRKQLQTQDESKIRSVFQAFIARTVRDANTEDAGTKDQDQSVAVFSQIASDEAQITAQFRSVRYPQECAQLASDYLYALQHTTELLQRNVERQRKVMVASDPIEMSKMAEQMQQEKEHPDSTDSVDADMAKADQDLSRLRSQYPSLQTPEFRLGI